MFYIFCFTAFTFMIRPGNVKRTAAHSKHAVNGRDIRSVQV